MSSLTAYKTDSSQTLAKALLNAGKTLGLTQSEIGLVIGRDRSALHRKGLDPRSKSGELALLLIRLYRSLYALLGGGAEDLRHWMKTMNRHTGGVPADQVKTVQGLLRVVEYLDAIRGKH
ncbi:MAG: MbcA/ParS/Xre antitoxin family protein [Candidatus Thiodiazotropha sp. (ex Epidulcina cf. delphinae)]|nr:MbcA/ParS/Xre antitoxin family protein [Candidatus Thiodiazotropha sp. (ex Epidulcina cf. delphinae)]